MPPKLGFSNQNDRAVVNYYGEYLEDIGMGSRLELSSENGEFDMHRRY